MTELFEKDLFIKTYKFFKGLFFTILITLLTLKLLVTPVVISKSAGNTDMVEGDIVLTQMATSNFITKSIFSHSIGSLFFVKTFLDEKIVPLRIYALPGNTIKISNAVFSVENSERIKYPFPIPASDEVLDGTYSVRDNVASYTIPKVGDTIELDKLSLRDLIYTYGIIKQEERKDTKLKADLYINDTLKNNFQINNFSLYEGKFSNIPDSVKTSYIFWFWLEKFLKDNSGEDFIDVYISIEKDGTTLHDYIVKSNLYFMLSDNWFTAADSRLFGPVSEKTFYGIPFCILVSLNDERKFPFNIRFKRTFKIIKSYRKVING